MTEFTLWLLVGTALAGPAWSATGTQEVDRLVVPLSGPESIVLGTLSEDDLLVRFDDQTRTVHQLYRAGTDLLEPVEGGDWQVLIYIDTPLATADGLRKSLGFLTREAGTLTNLGPTEIVLADPQPRRFLESTDDPVAIKEALHDLRSEALTTGELLWHRQRFVADGTGGETSAVSEAVREEVEIIERQKQGLLLWLAEHSSTGPRLLILVQNGHDMNPGRFYSNQAASSFLEHPRDRITQTVLSRAVATDGWTVICLALGPKPDEFTESSAPLFELARASGGEVVTSRRSGSRLLTEIASWPILVVNVPRDELSGSLPLEVQYRPTGQTIKTRQWASAGPSSMLDLIELDPRPSADQPRPVVQLLRPAGLSLQGEVRFRTIAGRQRIHRVEFLLDDTVVAETERTPYSAVIDLGNEVLPHRIAVVAYSRSGRSLGEDTIHLNMALQPPRVTITTLEHDPQEGTLEVMAVVSTPSGVQPDLVEVFFNDHRKAALSEAPFRVRIPVSSLVPTDFVQVLAHYPTGDTAEAARLLSMTDPGDELVVNLVELLAMVTPRNRKMKVDLERGDFVIRQQGKPLHIDQFSHWEELQLTLGLVLDTSDSMEEVIEDAREAGERFFKDALKDGDEAFVVDFNDLPRLARHKTTDSEQLLHSLTGLEARGMTALYDAIVFSLQQFENSKGRRALVVLTDGEDSASFYQPSECVRQARLHGVPVYLIVLGSPPDPQREPRALRNLMVARRTGGEVYYISDLEDLSHIYDQIISELRRQYFLAFNAGHTLTPKELEEIEIDVITKGVQVRTLLASQQRGG